PYIDGVGLGIDFTARDVQETCKQQGLPWEKAKAFHDSAAVSEVLPLEAFPDPYRLDFELRVNGETRQKAHTDEMLFTLPQIMEHASRYFLVKIGDFVFTGTPAGVGPVQIGDHLEGFLNGRKLLDFYIK
ncbi:MAG: fumarylacetoacetate hydrolase family protein, partial [Sphingobacteriia bacterium]